MFFEAATHLSVLYNFPPVAILARCIRGPRHYPSELSLPLRRLKEGTGRLYCVWVWRGRYAATSADLQSY
jgi:hypothetical protein